MRPNMSQIRKKLFFLIFFFFLSVYVLFVSVIYIYIYYTLALHKRSGDFKVSESESVKTIMSFGKLILA